MLKNLKVLLLLASMLVLPQAHAGMLTFNFTDNANIYNITGSMTFANVTSPISNGQTVGWEVLGITGFVSGPGGGTITGLVNNPTPALPYTAFGYLFDNVVYLAEPYVDSLGIVFETDLGYMWNLYQNQTYPTIFELHSYGAGVIQTGSLSIVEELPVGPGPSPGPGLPPGPIHGVPEPGTILLFGIGLIGLSLLAHPKQQKSMQSYS